MKAKFIAAAISAATFVVALLAYDYIQKKMAEKQAAKLDVPATPPAE